MDNPTVVDTRQDKTQRQKHAGRGDSEGPDGGRGWNMYVAHVHCPDNIWTRNMSQSATGHDANRGTDLGGTDRGEELGDRMGMGQRMGKTHGYRTEQIDGQITGHALVF